MTSILPLLRTAALLSILLIFTGMTAHAAGLERIAADFKAVPGYVVMQDGEEYIIDLDATHGIAKGDLFSVVGAGEKIIHPVSKKTLGTLEVIKALLKVTRVKSGYSYARRIGARVDIKRGDTIRRYGNLSAVFWDYTGKGRTIFDQLESNLPNLKWEDYETSQQNRPATPGLPPHSELTLTFILTTGSLAVHDPQFDIRHRYSILDSGASTESDQSTAMAAATTTTTVVVTQNRKSVAVDKPVGVKPTFKKIDTLANLPRASLITDFIQSGPRLLMASTDGYQIDVYDIADEIVSVAEARPSYMAKILSVKWWQPNPAGPAYIAATAWSDHKLRSTLFIFRQGKLVPFIERIDRILGSFDLDNDGTLETLFGQKFDGELFFGQGISKLTLSNATLVSSGPGLVLPRNFTVLGSVLADVTGDGKLEIIYVRNSILWVFSGTKLLYKSPKQMGGSLSFLTYDIDPAVKDVQTTTVSIELAPVVANIDGDKSPELISIASERTLFGTIRVTPGIKKTWLEVHKYQDGRFVAGTLGDEMVLPLQGLAIADKKVLMVATETGDLPNEILQSHLLAYPIAQ